MRVYDETGACVAESPSRDPETVAREVMVQLNIKDPAPGNSLAIDAANLAPINIELEAVRRYALCGSLAQVSRDLGIAIYQLQKLQRAQWWQDELAALRRESCAIKNASLERIHEKTLSELEDRLEHGDYIATASGRLIRQKLSGKDLARISEAVFKQRQLLMGEPTEIKENGRLKGLAAKLEALGKRDPIAAARIIEAEAIDVTAREIDSHSLAQEARGTSAPMPDDQLEHAGSPTAGDGR